MKIIRHDSCSLYFSKEYRILDHVNENNLLVKEKKS